ncbi:DUF47 family protein [candidate division KSB1 bacterium]|nr:DUF47 family protein [candidate division KSB1 bacterium]
MSKEKKVRENIEEHLAAIGRCVGAAMEGVSFWLDKKTENLYEKFQIVSSQEHKADFLRREIYQQLGDGAFLPILRGDIHHFVQIVDELGGDAKEVIKIIVFEKIKFVGELEDIQAIVEITEKQTAILLDLGKTFFDKHQVQAEELRKHLADITNLEQKIDILENKSIAKIFDSSLPLAQKLHLKQFVTQLVHISDQVQDIADSLSELNVKMQI